MKPIYSLALAAFTVALLSACGKTSNGSDASTPASACTISYDGQMRNSSGQLCSASTTTCPSTGYYTSYNGQQVACVPGQVVNTGYTQSFQPPGQYPYTPYPQTQQVGGCTQYYYQYGVQYVPILMQGQYVCVNINYLQPYIPQTSMYANYGYDYYYAYPPYSGSGCGTKINFGGDWGYVGVCF